eukprot:15459834-Alexandrium_andersonii.AAC.1
MCVRESADRARQHAHLRARIHAHTGLTLADASSQVPKPLRCVPAKALEAPLCNPSDAASPDLRRRVAHAELVVLGQMVSGLLR